MNEVMNDLYSFLIENDLNWEQERKISTRSPTSSAGIGIICRRPRRCPRRSTSLVLSILSAHFTNSTQLSRRLAGRRKEPRRGPQLSLSQSAMARAAGRSSMT